MNIYEQAIEIFGAQNQVKKTIEELTELSLALQHYPEKDDLDHVCEEVADVEIMMAQMRILLGNRKVRAMKNRKLDRLRNRVNKISEVEVITIPDECGICPPHQQTVQRPTGRLSECSHAPGSKGESMNHKQIADAYRMRYPEKSKGVIIIYGAHVTGWCEVMPLASDWEPGCFAVDGDGNVFVSVGGNPWDGAERWEPVKSGNSESVERHCDTCRFLSDKACFSSDRKNCNSPDFLHWQPRNGKEG